ncbi:MAG: hypothetical protein ACTSYB_05490 [Candidatus Helarchaeota archaeon]
MDWNAVETGFHWIVPSDPRKPPGDFWVWCNYRMAMWLIYLPISLVLISLIFKILGNSKPATIKLNITNFLIFILGFDSIFIFIIAGGNFPPHWNWANIHYSLLDGFYNSFSLILWSSIILGMIIIIYKVYYTNMIHKDEK